MVHKISEMKILSHIEKFRGALYEVIKYDMNLDEIRISKYKHHRGAHKILKRGDLTLEFRRDPVAMENCGSLFREIK